MGKYYAAYTCKLCGKKIMFGEVCELPDEVVGKLLQEFLSRQKFASNPYLKTPPMYLHHRCQDGSSGLAQFSGFQKT